MYSAGAMAKLAMVIHSSVFFAGRGVTRTEGAKIYGGFHKWRYPNSWVVYKGKSH